MWTLFFDDAEHIRGGHSSENSGDVSTAMVSLLSAHQAIRFGYPALSQCVAVGPASTCAHLSGGGAKLTDVFPPGPCCSRARIDKEEMKH